jgi:hypothetical protein
MQDKKNLKWYKQILFLLVLLYYSTNPDLGSDPGL